MDGERLDVMENGVRSKPILWRMGIAGRSKVSNEVRSESSGWKKDLTTSGSD